MREFWVPKRRTQIEVVSPGGVERSFSVFLSDCAAGHAGHEHLSDLLNDGRAFFPAFDIAGEQIVFLHKEGIVLARVPAENEVQPDDPPHLPDQPVVEVRMADGSTVRGRLRYSAPPERARPLDFLNDAPSFFRLFQGETIVLVNKRHVFSVAPLRS